MSNPIQTLRECFEGANVDYQGTSSGRAWRERWETALKQLETVYVVTHGERHHGGEVVGVRHDFEDAKILALMQPRHFPGEWTPQGENYWINGCDFVEIRGHQVK